MLNLDQVDVATLRSLVAVVDHGGFRAAARETYVSQAVLTRKVRALEASLGLRLLERGPGGARPTSDCVALLPAVRQVLRAAEEFLGAAANPGEWTLRLGLTPSVAGLVMAPFMAWWLPTHPEVRIISIEDGVVGLRARLADRECEVALINSPLPDFADGVYIRRTEVIAYIPPAHRLAGHGPLDVGALDREPIMVNSRQFLNATIFWSACDLAGCEPDVRYESSSPEALALLSQAGLAITVTGDLIPTSVYDVARRPLVTSDGSPLGYDLYLAWDARRTLTRGANAFIEGFVAHLQQERAGRPAETA